ncbi:PfkB family carbohydrate kinase [Hespellia stercorisuis]|uniref:Ribokinase n=1 Tax=Hespellia stercorisuis DSM 15480 TaxID=1121950 RepID=A0A1M6KAL9_9FIRM|nr:PfkB family carbohydrate kinase [Hespellia stercorisuis]SHJ56000.1 transcriptional regulator, LacI family [Hespellia stercorisuis DSM 15480]
MTIKEIAQIANVSVSTVSKIMNHKDSSISAETRERVLKIAKEYHYTPYAAAMQSTTTKTWIIGIVMQSVNSIDMALSGILEEAQKNGYSINLFDSQNDPETERKNIAACCTKHFDGVIWETLGEESLKEKAQLERAGIPFEIANVEIEGSFCPNYSRLSYNACEKLIQNQHARIGCLVMDGRRTAAIIKGYKNCLFDHQLNYDENNIFTEVGKSLLYKIKNHTITGIICSHFSLAIEFFRVLTSLGYHIPEDVSIISMRSDIRDEIFLPELSTFTIPKRRYGVCLCRNFINKIEQKDCPPEPFEFDTTLSTENSISGPYERSKRQILVVGSVNVDTYLNVDQLPSVRQTIKTSVSSSYPGGKAINQAVGVAKLGMPVAVLGSVGSDVHSDLIFSSLNHYDISTEGIARIGNSSTGHAYIITGHDGNSMITILEGANANLLPEDIVKNERVFYNTEYCLVQTEIPLDTVHTALKLARLHGAKTILKPSACGELPDDILADVDIIVPNVDELSTICPEGQTIEEKSKFLLGKGISCVIVTLGSHGIYRLDRNGAQYYDAVLFSVVDATGASDAFISALAAYLMQGYDMDSAIQIGSIAAAFSITREGVVPSLVSKTTLETYLYQKEPELLK